MQDSQVNSDIYCGNTLKCSLSLSLSCISGDLQIEDFLSEIFESRSLNTFIGRSLAKTMGGILIVTLIVLATIVGLAWMLLICALKPGCLVYKWRESKTH